MLETNIVYHEDCLSGMDRIPDHCIDAIICDLPYGSTRNSWDIVIPFDKLWNQYERVIKENGAIVLFGQGMFTSALMQSNPKMWRYNLIWQKTQPTGFLNAARMPLRSHEDICVFYKKLPVYNPIMTKGKRKVSSAFSKRNCVQTSNYGSHALTDYDSDQRYPTSVLCFAKDVQMSSIHPTQKPVALIEWLVKTFTNPGAVVMDNCMGSGTTAIACLESGRKYIGFEIEEKYFQSIQKRISDYMTNHKILEKNDRNSICEQKGRHR